MIDAVMYGMIPSAKSAKLGERAAREELQEGEHAALLGLLGQLLHGLEVDARDRAGRHPNR